jgi:hypothetical protein
MDDDNYANRINENIFLAPHTKNPFNINEILDKLISFRKNCLFIKEKKNKKRFIHHSN